MDYSRIADLYDICVQTDVDIPFFLEEAGRTEGEVLELMAGTGRVALPLVEAGARLTCVDNCPEMLAVLSDKLARRGLSAQVVQMDVRELDLGRRFSLILIPFNSFSELLTEEDQRAALERVHDHLADGGRFICTLHNPAVRLETADGHLRLVGRCPRADGLVLLWLLERYDAVNHLVEGLEFFEEYDGDGIMHCRRCLHLRFCPLSRREFEEQARACGFTINAFYGDYSREPFHEEFSPFMIWVLEA